MTVRKFLCLFVVVFGLFVGASPESHAQGIPVYDQDEIIETLGVIAKQVMQFEVMLNQFKTQIRNTIGPLFFIYDQVQDIRQLFARDSLLVEKKSKNGPTQQDIIPMIKSLEVLHPDDHTVKLHALVCCQNPSLNPMQLAAAIEHGLPELKADHATCKRLEIYDINNHLFR